MPTLVNPFAKMMLDAQIVPQQDMTVDQIDAAMIDRDLGEARLNMTPPVLSVNQPQEQAADPQFFNNVIQSPVAGQYDRITSLLQKAQNQPMGEELTPAQNEINYLYGMLPGRSYLDLTRAAQDRNIAAQERQIQSGKDMVALAEQAAASGDKETARILERIKLFTGDDPEGIQMFMQKLHELPYPVNSQNIMAALGRINSETGYSSSDFSYQKRKKELELRNLELQGNLYDAKASGTSGGAGGSTKFERNKNRLIELAGKKDLTPLEKQELDILKVAVETEAQGGMDPEKRGYGMVSGKNFAEAQINLPKAELNAGRSIRVIKDLINDPAINTQTGLVGLVPARPGSAGYNFNQKFKQLDGVAFTEGIQALVGMGSLSNAEGQAAIRSFTSLSRGMSKDDFVAEATNLINFVEAALNNARQAASAPISERFIDNQNIIQSPQPTAIDASEYFK